LCWERDEGWKTVVVSTEDNQSVYPFSATELQATPSDLSGRKRQMLKGRNVFFLLPKYFSRKNKTRGGTYNKELGLFCAKASIPPVLLISIR